MPVLSTFHHPGTREVPRLIDRPGTVLDLLVVAVDDCQCAGVDVASGALVRAWSPEIVDPQIRPYDTVKVTVASDPDRVPDPAEPEAIVLSSAPELSGRLVGRRAERLLRPLLHPRHTPLLGFHGPAVAFWQRKPDHPSIALVEPDGPVVLKRHGTYLSSRFSWSGIPLELPCLDRRLAGVLDRTNRRSASLKKGTRLVVALTPPLDGHCHKVIEAILPER